MCITGNYVSIDDLRRRIGIHVPRLESERVPAWEGLPFDVQTLIAQIIAIEPLPPYLVRFWSDAGDKQRHWRAFLNVHLLDLHGWDEHRAYAALGKAIGLGLALRPNPTGGLQYIGNTLVSGDYVYLTEAAHEAWKQAGMPKVPLDLMSDASGGGQGGEGVVPPTIKRAQPAHVRAAASYEWACRQRPDLVPTDGRGKYPRGLWEYIHDDDCPAYRDEDGKTIKPPAFETWKRQVRAGQADPNNAKASQRAGREHGKSIVKASEV